MELVKVIIESARAYELHREEGNRWSKEKGERQARREQMQGKGDGEKTTSY